MYHMVNLSSNSDSFPDGIPLDGTTERVEVNCVATDRGSRQTSNTRNCICCLLPHFQHCISRTKVSFICSHVHIEAKPSPRPFL